MSCALPQERAVLRVHHEHLEPALHQHQESHLVAVLPQGHQLHQLPHPQHGETARLTLMTFFFLLFYRALRLLSQPDPPLIVPQLSKMRPEEYRSLIKRLETHYQEFLQTSKGSEMFGEDEKKTIQGHFEKAQDHYETLVIQLPAYSEFQTPSTDTNIVKTMQYFSYLIFNFL